MTVNGVAIATVLSNTVSSLILFVKLMRTEKWIRLDLRKLKIHKDSLLTILQIGLPAGIQSAVFNIANVVIQSAINSLGTVVIAASSAAYIFSMLYEVMSGYLRGFGISFVPAILTILGVCGVRIAWVYTAFPKNPTFRTLLMAYPLSLSITALLILGALLFYHPSRSCIQKTES